MEERIMEYVKKFCAKEKMSTEQAMETAMVKNYIEYVGERAQESRLPNMWGSAGDAHDNMADI